MPANKLLGVKAISGGGFFTNRTIDKLDSIGVDLTRFKLLFKSAVVRNLEF